MQITFAFLTVAIIGYLLGSLNFAIIISKCMNNDVRSHGSGNAGMTNVLRTFGKLPAALTFAGDFLKGTISVYLCQFLFKLMVGQAVATPHIMLYVSYTAAIGALLGHMFPMFFGFKGGKGVSVTAGVILALNPWVLLILLVIFVAVVVCWHYISLGSLVVAVAYPISVWIVNFMQKSPFVWQRTVLAAVMGVLVFYMHRENLKRLLAGNERKLGQKN